MLNHENDNLQEPADGQITESTQDVVNTNEVEKALDSIHASNAAQSEVQNIAEAEETIPTKDYASFDLDMLTTELKTLIDKYAIKDIKDHVEDIKKEFSQKLSDILEDKKEAFLEENPEAQEHDFDLHLPIKDTFFALYDEYKEQRNAYYKQLQNSLNNNLAKRLALIERLKELITDEDRADALKQLADIREEWKVIGAIPKDKYNVVWNDFHFHIERFYDQLHLDRQVRDLDFKHNLEQKERIIAKAEELLQRTDVIKAFRELQTLHRIWREELGPVAKEEREAIWQKFSEITKQLHDKRETLFENLRAGEQENLYLKVTIISEIDLKSKQNITNHNQWQKEIAKVEELRNKFFSIGKVPSENNEEVWDLFKLATRNFNAKKNVFYKELKREQQENYGKKLALIEKAVQLKDSEDFRSATPIMKKIQDEWKTIGHVPRRYSDQLWKEFRDACNHYFDRFHAIQNTQNQVALDVYNRKKEYLSLMKGFQLSGDHKTDLAEIKNHISNWKSLGRVPENKRFIEGKFNKILDDLFESLNISRREAEVVKFNNRLEELSETNDRRQIQNEGVFIQRKIEDINSEILQLENNLSFIQNPSNSNIFVKEVNKNIEKLKEDLAIWQEKMDQLKSLQNPEA